MGLSASQARLLTITARKSDCEFQSMQLSHEKLSVSRELALLSNQYQSSLDKTKLMYDYYGTGTNLEQMNYNTLMYPSSLNDVRPITMTNSLNRVILDSKLANAARVAGIPQEGLGCSPSTAVRNQFAYGLLDSGVIDENVYNSIINSPYNQTAGLGSDGASFEYTDNIDLDDLKKIFLGSNTSKLGSGINSFTQSDHTTYFEKEFSTPKDPDRIILKSYSCEIGGDVAAENVSDLKSGSSPLMNASIYELLNLDGRDEQYYLTTSALRGDLTPVTSMGAMQYLLLDQGGILDWITEEFTNALGFNDKCIAAINFEDKKLKLF